MKRNEDVDKKSSVKGDDSEKKEYTILGISSQISPAEDEGRDNKHSYNYARSLSSREMESLIALCDTLIPSIDISKDGVVDDSLDKLYHTSASMIGTPNQVSILFLT